MKIYSFKLLLIAGIFISGIVALYIIYISYKKNDDVLIKLLPDTKDIGKIEIIKVDESLKKIPVITLIEKNDFDKLYEVIKNANRAKPIKSYPILYLNIFLKNGEDLSIELFYKEGQAMIVINRNYFELDNVKVLKDLINHYNSIEKIEYTKYDKN